MKPDSIEQTILKLRDRVAFLERANQFLAADRNRVMAEFVRCEEVLGTLGGLSLSGAIAVQLGRIKSREEKAVERERSRALSIKSRRMTALAELHPADTGLIGDDF